MSQITTILVTCDDIEDENFYPASCNWLQHMRGKGDRSEFYFRYIPDEANGGDKALPCDLWLASFNCFELDEFISFLNANGFNEDNGFQLLFREDDHGLLPNMWQSRVIKTATWTAGDETKENHAEKKEQP